MASLYSNNDYSVESLEANRRFLHRFKNQGRLYVCIREMPIISLKDSDLLEIQTCIFSIKTIHSYRYYHWSLKVPSITWL